MEFGIGKKKDINIRPWPPTKKIASKSFALPTNSDNLCVFFHKFSWCDRNLVDTASFLKASTEEGSRGASPPWGEATTISHCEESTS